jgi:sugar-specific transcriptional regulator TrmB
MKQSLTSDSRLELLFRHAGLSEKQAKLYRLLLATGEEKAGALTKKSGMKRGNVYALLGDLVARGLVAEKTNGTVTSYIPEPPGKLAGIIDAREKEVYVAKQLAEDLIPDLTGQYKSAVGKPVIRYFHGEEGLKTVLEDIYAAGKKQILGCVGLEHPSDDMYSHIIKRLVPLRIKRGIHTIALNSDSERVRELQKHDTEQLRKIYRSDPEKYPLPAEIDVYGDKVAFLSFAKGDFTGVVIENHDFAVTLTSVFKRLFDALDRLQPNSAPSSLKQE